MHSVQLSPYFCNQFIREVYEIRKYAMATQLNIADNVILIY